MAAYKARGGVLGAARPECRKNLTSDAAPKGVAAAALANRRLKLTDYADLVPPVQEMRGRGRSLRAIAADLNADGQTTRRGKQWNASQVQRVLLIDRGPRTVCRRRAWQNLVIIVR